MFAAHGQCEINEDPPPSRGHLEDGLEYGEKSPISIVKNLNKINLINKMMCTNPNLEYKYSTYLRIFFSSSNNYYTHSMEHKTVYKTYIFTHKMYKKNRFYVHSFKFFSSLAFMWVWE